MSVTVSGGILHVPEWSLRVDQIKEMYDSDQDGMATVMWSMDSDCDTFCTTATRAEIIAALEAWELKQAGKMALASMASINTAVQPNYGPSDHE